MRDVVADEMRERVVFLTGGASGIGAALSQALRSLGTHVIELDRTPLRDNERLPAAEVATSGPVGNRHRVVGDVTDPEANEQAVALAREQYGRLDAFIGNAGVHDGGAHIASLTAADMRMLARRVLDVNVVGYLVGAAAAADAVTRAEGTMVFTLSDASFVVSGNGAGPVYAASKHGALGVVRSLAAQLAPRVRVNAVAPGGVPTSLTSIGPGNQERAVYAEPDTVVEQVRALNPLGTVLSAEDLVGHYLFLLTSQSRGLTGHVLRPDGGLSVA